MNKETSSRVSSIAAKIMNAREAGIRTNFKPTPDEYNALLRDAKTLAASCLSQDETPGEQPGPGPHKIPSGIHPAPAEFSAAQIAQDQILHFFHYAHLPPKLQATSRLFFILAAAMVNTLPRNPERTVALRKLLEAKDAAVRANLPVPGLDERPVASRKWDDLSTLEKNAIGHGVVLGEPRETGGHNEDRDGPIPFDC